MLANELEPPAAVPAAQLREPGAETLPTAQLREPGAETLPTARLLERGTELETVGDVFARASGGAGGLVVIDGPAGVGKTALLEAARAEAAAAGLLTLQARAAELERAFAFGVVRQLFDDAIRDSPIEPQALFTGPARRAAALFDVELDSAPPAPPEDPFAARHALYWLTARLASREPLALLVDDGHWADAASLGYLTHLAHRLQGIPAALVVATRTEEPLPALEPLRRQAGQRATLLHVSPLGEEAAAIMVRSCAPGADDAVCRACHSATGGNPFLLLELARSALRDDVAADPARVAEQSPERVTSEIAARLARLPEPAARLARAAAVLGGGVSLPQAAALADVPHDDAAPAADTLVAAGVLGGAHPLEFQHPLIRAAVYAGLGPATRSEEHARAARLLAEEGASPERVAAQLLRCQPGGDRWAYDGLVAAARLASARGAAEAAVTYLRRALEEPAPPELRPEVLLELGAAESTASDPDAAIAHLREALVGDVDVDLRFRATMLLAGLLGHSWRVAEAADLLEEQLEALADRPDLRATAEVALTNVARLDPTTRPRAASVIARLRRRVENGDESDTGVLGTVAAEMAMAGEPAELTAQVAERALVGFDAAGRAAPDWSSWNAIRALVHSGRYDTALPILDRALELADERGAVLDVGAVYTFRGELHLHTGELAKAEADARALHELSRAFGWPSGAGFAVAWLLEVLVERGETAEAESLLEEAGFTGPAAAFPTGYTTMHALFARGRLRLAQGRLEEAAEDLRESGRRATGIEHVNPSVVAWRSHLAYALLELGEADEARRLADAELELACAFGAPRAVGAALRGAAHVAGGQSGLKLLREAAEALGPSPATLERARVHADLGAALRRAGSSRKARDPLRLAVDLAHRCGARALEEHALEELRAAGARPRRLVTTGAGALTPSESRIAELAAAGNLNREIAEALFVTTHTVEYHLRNAYRKLGIASRRQLTQALGS
ncbi:MAG TPA: AAA family ATPase [Thermoleophilaceae bacterium]